MALSVLFGYNRFILNIHKGRSMVTIEFLGPIQKEAMRMEASTLREVSDALKQDPQMAEWIESCAVAVNDVLVASLDTPLSEGDRISLLPPVCGG